MTKVLFLFLDLIVGRNGLPDEVQDVGRELGKNLVQALVLIAHPVTALDLYDRILQLHQFLL